MFGSITSEDLEEFIRLEKDYKTLKEHPFHEFKRDLEFDVEVVFNLYISQRRAYESLCSKVKMSVRHNFLRGYNYSYHDFDIKDDKVLLHSTHYDSWSNLMYDTYEIDIEWLLNPDLITEHYKTLTDDLMREAEKEDLCLKEKYAEEKRQLYEKLKQEFGY